MTLVHALERKYRESDIKILLIRRIKKFVKKYYRGMPKIEQKYLPC
jgi:hypothetical protein